MADLEPEKSSNKQCYFIYIYMYIYVYMENRFFKKCIYEDDTFETWSCDGKTGFDI